MCVSVCAVALLCWGLGQCVTGAVADPREGLFAGQGSHSIHPVTHRPHWGNLWTASVQQQVGWPDREEENKQVVKREPK